MELLNFTEKTVNALTDYFGPEVEIRTHNVYKNNGILLQGICALEKGKNIAPTVYLNDFCAGYEEGEPFGEIINKIIQFMENNRVVNNLNVDFFMDYENVRKKLVLRLINKEKNEELLKQVPYLKFKDLAIVCHCIMITEEIGTGSILIHKHHLESWNIVEDTLFQDAFENSPKIEPYSILKMSDMMKNVLRETVKDQIDEICEEYPHDKEELLERTLESMAQEIEDRHIPMYVLTNGKRYYGAASLVYPDMLDHMGNMLQEDFYILPSSVHEIIFIGKTDCVDSFTLNEMIEEINRTQVDEEEWLSDHAYLYQRKNQKLISITNHQADFFTANECWQ